MMIGSGRQPAIVMAVISAILAGSHLRSQNPLADARAEPSAGVVVEAVPVGSVAEAAGIRVDDTILWWSLTNDPVQHAIRDPLDFLTVQLEQLPRTSILLAGMHDGKPTQWTLERGLLGLTIRPLLSRDLLDAYRAGRELIRNKHVAEGARQLRLAADRSSDAYVTVWLLAEIGAALSNIAQFDDADRAFGEARSRAEPLNRPGLMAQLHRQRGRSYQQHSDWTHAIDEFEAALTLDADGSAENLTTALDQESIGNVVYTRGDLAVADIWYQKALVIREHLAPAGIEVANTLMNLAGVANERSDLDGFESYMMRALPILESLAPRTLMMARAQHNLGILSHNRGQYALAEERYRRALAIREAAAPDSLELAGTLNSLGLLARERGHFTESEGLLQRAIAIQERDAPSSMVLAQSLANLGSVFTQRGDLSRAEEFQQRAVDIRQRLAPGSIALSGSFNNLANVLKERGDLDRAENYYREALAIRERLAPGSKLVASGLTNLGALLQDRQELDGAADYYRRALAIHERVDPDSIETATTRNNLAQLLLEQHDVRSADMHLRRSLAILDKTAPDSINRITTRLLIAISAEEQSHFASARDYTLEALKLAERVTPTSRQMADALHLAAEISLKQHDVAGAEAYARRAVALLGEIEPGSHLEAGALHALGVVYRDTNRRDLALTTFRRAIDAFEKQFSRIGAADDARSRFSADANGIYRDAVRLALELGQPGEAFALQERFRARSMLAMLAERDVLFRGDVPVEIAREQRLGDAEYDRVVGALASSGADPAARAGLIARLRELRASREGLAARIRDHSPRMAALQYPEPLDLRRVRSSLDSGTLMLAYWVDAHETVLFAVEPGPESGTPAGLAVFRLPVGERTLAARVNAFRQQIQAPAALGDQTRAVGGITTRTRDAPTTTDNQAEALYSLLVKPAAALVGHSQRVVIVPDGPLHSLPFSALRVPARGRDRARYLVEWKPLHLAVSATVYDETRKSRHESQNWPTQLVAFGDPHIPQQMQPTSNAATSGVRPRRNLTFAPLPATRREVESIAALFPGSSVYVGRDATEERVKALGSDVRYVHFASHAFVDPTVPIDSALVLSIPDAQDPARDNGLLQVWEVFDRMHLNADLVTLSACETALGEELHGEGLMGLTRAFQYAGARSVMASLWSIADDSTATLMTTFYQYLKGGKSKDDALRFAQLDAIRGGPTASNPFNWAAFEMFGDWR